MYSPIASTQVQLNKRTSSYQVRLAGSARLLNGSAIRTPHQQPFTSFTHPCIQALDPTQTAARMRMQSYATKRASIDGATGKWSVYLYALFNAVVNNGRSEN